MNNITGKDLLLSSISKYFKNNVNEIIKLKDIISGKSIISLRLIDWLLTHHSKNNNIQYWINDDTNIIYKKLPLNIDVNSKFRKVNMHTDYRAQLKSFSKMYFDPFRRHDRILYNLNDDSIIQTTIGQLNLFRWFFKNKIYEYIMLYYSDIILIMTNKIKINKKNTDIIKIEKRIIHFT